MVRVGKGESIGYKQNTLEFWGNQEVACMSHTARPRDYKGNFLLKEQ